MSEIKNYFGSASVNGSALESFGWFLANSRNEVPREEGLYAIFEQRSGFCLYVGKSKNLWRRLSTNQYWSKAQKEYPNACIYYFVVKNDASERVLHLECLTIGLLKPKWNFAPKYSNLAYTQQRIEFLSESEFDLILSNQNDFRVRIILCLGYLAGMSSAEISYLEWKDINFEFCTINISGRGKGAKRTIPMNPELRNLLGQSVEFNSYVLLSQNGNRLNRTAIHRLIKEAAGRAGHEKGFSVSTLRNSYGLNLMNSGESLSSISQKLGVKLFRALKHQTGHIGYLSP